MPPPSPRHLEAEGAGIRDHVRHERSVKAESFPQFEEPLLTTKEELDHILNLRTRQPCMNGKVKPSMRVDPSMLRGSGLLDTLPEFLGQLARANLETETQLASNAASPGFELDDETAAQQPHVEMDVYTGLVEAQVEAQGHPQQLLFPGGQPLTVPGDDESVNSGEANDADNESDGSSTITHLRANQKKRKTRQMSGSGSGSEEDYSHQKVRIHYEPGPPEWLVKYDMEQGKLVRNRNPDYVGFDLNVAAPTTTSVRGQSGEDSSSSSSGGPTRIIKIKVPESSGSSSSSSDRDSASTRPSNMVTPPPPTRRIIILKSPRYSSSPSASSSARPSPAPATALGPETTTPSASPASPPASEVDSESPAEPIKRKRRIVIVQRSPEGDVIRQGPAKKARRSPE